MSDFLRQTWARIVALVLRREHTRDLDEELETHVQLATADEMRNGHSAAEARRRALIRLGGITQTREQHADARSWPSLSAAARDVRDAWRLIRRHRGFTAVAVLSLALGIGANTAIFSLLNALVLRPLPVREPGQLVQLSSAPNRSAWTYPLWEELKARPDLLDSTTAWSSTNLTPVSLINGAEMKPLSIAWSSGNFFDVLGIQPARGRALTQADDEAAAKGSVAAVVSDAFWRREMNADPDAVGEVLTLSRFPVTVVGVAPPEFFGPEVGRTFDIALPIRALPPLLLQQRTFWWLIVWGRLRPGQTVDMASAALNGIRPQLREATLPADQRADIRDAYLNAPLAVTSVGTGRSDLRGRYQNPLIATMIGVVLLLAIGCANLTNLLLARGDARRHEFSLRLALGASRAALVRQLLIECVMLAGLGAVAGLAAAVLLSRMLVARLGNVTLDTPLDWRVLAFTATTSILAAIVIGLVPAFRTTRTALRSSLAERGRSIAAPRTRMASSLIVVQVALSLVLVSGAGLLVRSFVSLTRADLGFNPNPVLSIAMNLRPGAKWGDEAAMQRLLDAVRATPGVASASFSGMTTPMSGIQHDDYLESPPGLSLPQEQRDVYFRDAGIGWFDTLGMNVLMGREFSDADRANARGVAVINETLARRFFPGHNPIGQTLRSIPSPTESAVPMTVVGVVNDAVYNTVRDGVPPTLYRFAPVMTTILARAVNGEAASIVRGVTEAIRRENAAAFVNAKPLVEQADATVSRERLVATLSTIFGGLALTLAGVGLYGVISYGVGRRRTEIGVRRALGASSSSIASLVVGRSAKLVLIGTGIGIVGSLWALAYLEPLLYRLEPSDATTLGLSALLLAAVGLIASALPMWRALLIEPATALREG